MGLSNSFNNVSNDSIPLLLVVTAAGWVAHIRYLLHCLLHSCGLCHHHPSAVGCSGTSVASGLAGLIALADHINSHPAFPYSYGGARRDPDCVVCLYELRDGESVRKLSCCHVFHRECLDGWLDQMNFTCPLCRSPLLAEERRAHAQQRMPPAADWAGAGGLLLLPLLLLVLSFPSF